MALLIYGSLIFLIFINLLIVNILTESMLVRFIFIILIVVGLFTISLAVSYEGFQVSPNLRTQHMSVDDVLSTCNQMTSVLQSHEMSYEHLIRLLNNNEINERLNLGEIDIVKQCLEGKLPELSSYLIPQK